jgi:hypothetical protein
MKQKVNIGKVKKNETNPRFIKDSKFKKLVKSIKEFPEMLEKRPIIVDEDFVILGGNMRYEACKSAGLFEIWIDQVEGWTEQQKRQFIIKDNVGFGEWDWDILAHDFNEDQLVDWGLDVWQTDTDVDYSILDDDDFENELQDMQDGVKKAIQIPFELEHYDEAFELVKYWREKGGYVGMMLIEKLKLEKDQYEKN